MASSRLIARHARETSGRLAPTAHFAKFESRRNGKLPAHTLRVMAVMQSRADRETGPDVMVTSAQTQAVAFVFHELVTNAAKYGARLSRGRAPATPSPAMKKRHDRCGGGPLAVGKGR
jgi:hypothetical protein